MMHSACAMHVLCLWCVRVCTSVRVHIHVHVMCACACVCACSVCVCVHVRVILFLPILNPSLLIVERISFVLCLIASFRNMSGLIIASVSCGMCTPLVFVKQVARKRTQTKLYETKRNTVCTLFP